ncbi:MAG TPA: O-antigen ligase family protein [Acidimicrobiales bacterium]|nr:O-antigen ligase family protein [Acidimicrobiales bacterium]
MALSLAGVVHRGAPTVFLLFAGAVGVLVVGAGRAVARREEPWRSSRKFVLLVLLAVVPVLFDPGTVEGFNLPKYTVVAIGSFVLALLWILDWLRHRRFPEWRNGLTWPVLGLLGWTAVTTATSLDPRLSLLGDYRSYDGLYSAVAFTVLFFAIAESFALRDVKNAVSVLYFGAGGLVVLYGLMQLHDRTWSGPDWDWVDWGESLTFAKGSSIWSTFGNPNHLAGFLAMLLPIGLVLLLLHQAWWIRGLIVAMTAALMVELLQTSTRGAWLASIIAVILLVGLLRPRLHRRRRLAVSIMGLAVVAVLAAGQAFGSIGAVDQLASTFDFSGESTAAQRASFWKAAVSMANERPLVGVGPEGYATLSPRYDTRPANGPHNLFMNYLANQGYPGLLLFSTLLLFAGARTITAMKRLRRLEGSNDPSEARAAREARLILAALAAALAAYVVQASFNVQQIGLTFAFWALLGLIVVVTRAPIGAPLPADLIPRHRGTNLRTEAIAVLLSAIALFGFARLVSAPYRADRSYRAALTENAAARSAAARAEPVDRAAGRELVNRSIRNLKRAIALNPWEPTYLALLGQAKARAARGLPPGSPPQLQALAEARKAYEGATKMAPRDATLLHRYATILLEIDRVDSYEAATGSARRSAVAALRRAVRSSPLDKRFLQELKRVVAEPGTQ